MKNKYVLTLNVCYTSQRLTFIYIQLNVPESSNFFMTSYPAYGNATMGGE